MFEQLGQGAVVALSFFPPLALAAGATLALTARGTKGSVGEKRVSKALTAADFDLLEDLLIPAPKGEGLTQLDHLVLLPGALAVIETKAYRGTITGMEEGASSWTQQLGDREYAIGNPVKQNAWHAHGVIKIAGPEVKVLSFVCFSGEASFADTPPNGVYRHPEALVAALEDIKRRYRAQLDEKTSGGAPADPALEAWERVKAAQLRDQAARRAHRRQTGEARDLRGRLVEAALLSLGAVGSFAGMIAFWSSLPL